MVRVRGACRCRYQRAGKGRTCSCDSEAGWRSCLLSVQSTGARCTVTAEIEPAELSVRSRRADHGLVYRHTGWIDGSQLTVTYRVDAVEHERRRAQRCGAVTDEFALAAVLTLPEEDLAPIPDRFVPVFAPEHASGLAAVVGDPDGGFWGQRLLSPVVEVLEIETVAESWGRGCAVAHEWVGYGPRVVAVEDSELSMSPTLLMEASHYGIGVVAGAGQERVLEPAPFRPRRWTSARWRFAEIVYEQFLQLGRC